MRKLLRVDCQSCVGTSFVKNKICPECEGKTTVNIRTNMTVKTIHYEQAYVTLLKEVLDLGTFKTTRNANTYSLFGKTLSIDMSNSNGFPILQGRKVFPKGVLGEFAAMLRGPKHIDDFKKWGCNYWGQWANKDGSINVDYGNSWTDFNGVNQLEEVSKALRENPNDRRIIVSGWRPDQLKELNLPCCHMLYQWRVDGNKLDMIWYQRSVDMMVGLPSDVILAAAWNIALANEVGLQPGTITFMLGDTHIYEQHVQMCEAYISNFEIDLCRPEATYIFNAPIGQELTLFEPKDIDINYVSGPRLSLEVIT